MYVFKFLTVKLRKVLRGGKVLSSLRSQNGNIYIKECSSIKQLKTHRYFGSAFRLRCFHSFHFCSGQTPLSMIFKALNLQVCVMEET